jgi:hypothetical protein
MMLPTTSAVADGSPNACVGAWSADDVEPGAARSPGGLGRTVVVIVSSFSASDGIS